MKNRWKHWNETEDALLVRLISEGLTPAEMSENIQGRTKSAVYNRIYQKQEFLDAYRANSNERKRGAMLHTKEEISSIADDNRIWICLIGGLTSAVCSFATLLIVLLALLA